MRVEQFLRCKKNPGHCGFIPVDDFKLENLPLDMQTKEWMEYLQKGIDRTVLVKVTYTSVKRPDHFPFYAATYPFSEFRGCSNTVRCGTGFLEDEIVRVIEDEECTCPDCKNSGNPVMKFWQFVVSTATNVIFDESEAEHTVFELFYNSKDRRGIQRLYGTTMFEDSDTNERLITDHCKVICITHDQELANKLVHMLQQPADHIMHSVGMLVSHPHGAQKHVSVGKFLGLAFKFLKKGTNYFRFAPGMDETQLQLLKDVLFYKNRSPEVDNDDEVRDSTEMATETVEPESFFLNVNVAFPRFSSVQWESRDTSISKWCQFPPDTKFMANGGKVVEVPEGMEFDLDELYCYITYDIPTCPGSSGAKVLYNGKQFSHCGALPSFNRSGFVKATTFALSGHVDEDVISVGGSSLEDEGFADYLADAEMMYEGEFSWPENVVSSAGAEDDENVVNTEQEKPLNMLNDKVLQYLDNKKTTYPEVMSHEDDYYHVENYIEEESAMCPEQYRFQFEPGSLKEVLNKLVFNEKFAEKAANSVPDDILLSQEASYWAIRYLEDWQPCDQDGPYLYNTACRDAWFEHNIDLPRHLRGDMSGAGQKKTVTVNIYNTLNTKLDSSAIETESNFSYHYHGTSVTNAVNIFRRGIDLNCGMRRRDYSDGHGFYVSSDFFQAANWAHRGRGYPVVIVFKTPDDYFSDRTRHIHLRATDLITLAILKHFRSGCTDEIETIEKIENPSVDECESINGPILFNLEGFRNEEALVLKSHQTGIRKQNCANILYKYIHSVIFNP